MDSTSFLKSSEFLSKLVLIFSFVNLEKLKIKDNTFVENFNTDTITPDLYTAFTNTIALQNGSGILYDNILENLNILNHLDGDTHVYTSIQSYIDKFSKKEGFTQSAANSVINNINTALVNIPVKISDLTSTAVIFYPFMVQKNY